MTQQDEKSAGSQEKRAFPKPVLTPEQWQECRRAVEAGLEMKEAAEKFGIDYQAVKVRAWREKWLHDSRIKTLAAQVAEREAAKLGALLPNVTREAERPVSAASALVESLEGYRSQTLLGLAKLAKKGVENAVSADLPVENWQDAKIAAEIAMKLHQVGQEAVQVNICNAFADMDDGRTIETEAEVIESEDDRGSYFVDNE